MENAIWLVIAAVIFIGLVVGGFWVIAKSNLPKFVSWAFGAIVLIIILFALIYLVRGGYNGDMPRMVR